MNRVEYIITTSRIKSRRVIGIGDMLSKISANFTDMVLKVTNSRRLIWGKLRLMQINFQLNMLLSFNRGSK